MSDNEDRESRTLDASERKIQQAVEKGETPVSRETGLLASLVATFLCLSLLAREQGAAALNGLTVLFETASASLANPADVERIVMTPAHAILGFLAPALAILLVAAVVGGALQGKPRVVLSRIQPKWSRLSPMAGWRRIVSVKGLLESAKAAFKLVAFACILAGFLLARSSLWPQLLLSDPRAVPAQAVTLLTDLLGVVIICAALLAAADYGWSRRAWLRDLRMSHKEMRDEHKEQEGDPAVKARLRALANDRSRRRMMQRVPEATIVIANPTHFAVALRYVRDETAAPIVVARGQDRIALKIRAIAEAHHVPVIENKPLARSLHAATQLEQMIPPEFYRAVAELICMVDAAEARAGHSAG